MGLLWATIELINSDDLALLIFASERANVPREQLCFRQARGGMTVGSNSDLWCIPLMVHPAYGASRLWCIPLMVHPAYGASRLWCIPIIRTKHKWCSKECRRQGKPLKKLTNVIITHTIYSPSKFL
jgi:hypothetical protein